ncbi:Heme exporter protein D [Rhodovastum atsumiense]|uniref:Heme exporter protein D n=1 Tax=Rhodovastum atsumiense TaxID=504468 RepID=A0A5M6ISA1_9PROT|nr:heme exporter protein CcmD [Rhodovastum atsumiense]KAA5610448.1 heme exporter protein CcmD [Rhodovastum atsumiense]CAH2600432.1 Heme exporter protein D [Rhodovastum atsumiense]
MDHLTYIIAAYGLTMLVAGGFTVDAWARMRRARRRLAAIDPREARMEQRSANRP